MPIDLQALQAAAQSMGMEIDPVTGQLVPAQQGAAPPEDASAAESAGPGAHLMFNAGLGIPTPADQYKMLQNGPPPADLTIAGAPPPTVIPPPVPRIPGVPQGQPGGPPPVSFDDQVKAALGQKIGMPSPNLPPPSPTDDAGGATFADTSDQGYAPPTYATIPAHYYDTLGPELRQEATDDMAAGGQAIMAQRRADQSMVDARRQAANDLATAHEQAMRDAMVKEANRQAVLRANEDEQERAVAEVAKTQIDPDHYWTTRNAGQVVFGYLASIMGGFLAGKYGGENQALKEIDRAIDRDIAAQRDNLNNKQQKVANLRGLYAQKMQRFGDERIADAAAKSDLYATTIAKGDALAANAQSDQVDALWAKNRASLLDKKFALDAQTKKWMPAQTVQLGGGVGGAGGNAAVGGDVGAIEGTPIHIGNGMYIAPQKDVAPDLAQKITLNADLDNKLARLAALYDKRGTLDKAVPTDLANQIDEAIGQLDTVFNKAAGQGAMQGKDQQVTEQSIGVLHGWRDFTGDSADLVRKARAAVARSNGTLISTVGGGTVYRQAGPPVRDKSGVLRQQWQAVGQYDPNTGGVAGAKKPGSVSFTPSK